MADNYSFRSSVNGFNRNDVMAFVEKILEESEKQKEKINSLEQEIEKKNTEIEQLKAELNDNSGKCDTCDIAKVYEARLGAAMLDAKRFSEVLVKEANDTAFNMLSAACETAGSTSKKADEISGEIKNIADSFNESFNKLFEQMSTLGKGLKDFISEIDTNSKQFVYDTDFSDNKLEAAAENEAVKAEENAEYDVIEEKAATKSGFNPDFNFLESDSPIRIKVDTDA